MLQYMACAIPMVASPVGMNAQVLSMAQVGLPASESTDWFDALCALHSDRERSRAMGREGRDLVERHFARDAISGQLAQIMRRYA
jgi:glycosyltransferase involved in cell wall biosynthesis